MQNCAINYEAINEAYGEVSVSDEEDQIMKDVADKKGARRGGKRTENAKVVSKYERSVKAGYIKTKEGAEFPNYFVAQKVRSKISAAEEETGKRLFLKTEGKKKDKKGKGKKKERTSSYED